MAEAQLILLVATDFKPLSRKRYKEQADAKRREAMGELVAQAQELDLGY